MRLCPRCQRVNPDEAVFCYFDGFPVRDDAVAGAAIPMAIPVDAGPMRLPHEFVFPSGRRCATYDDLVQTCLEDWPTACGLLGSGAFRQYLTAGGRLDLAHAAEQAVQQNPDADAALDAFLARLPAVHPPRPELELNPRKLLLGALVIGESRQAQLVVQNIGTGLLHGRLNVVDGGNWLRLAGGDGTSIPLKVAREQTVPFAVVAQGVPAPMKCAARLTVITNGGIVEVPVRLDVTPQAFPHAPYVGAMSPRDLAVLIRANPKPAIPMFENGLIVRWFETNGWGYPVIGPPAPGMAAVQQFFEALGLAKPPRVQLEPSAARFTCLPGEMVSGRVALVTADRKWVYATARCPAPSLRITTPAVSGPQRAGIEFEIDTRSLTAGRVYETAIEIIANGAQRLAFPVRLELQKRGETGRPTVAAVLSPPPAIAAPLRMPTPSLPGPRTPSARGRRSILAVALLALTVRLLLAGPADLYARVLAAAPGEAPRAGSFASWKEAPLSAEFVRHFVLATGWVGAVVALVLLLRRGRLLDLPYGIVAGAGAGLAASGTLACLLPLLDWPARLVWRLLPAVAPLSGESVWLATGAWVVLAAACWAVLGAAGAVLCPRRS